MLRLPHHSLLFMMAMEAGVELRPLKHGCARKHTAGPAVAKCCAKPLQTELCTNEHFHSNLSTAVEITISRMDVMLRDRDAGKELSKYGSGNGQWKKCRKDMWLKPVYEGPLEDGCTACVALIGGNNIIVGNAGDSRCIISKNGQAMDLSSDHEPNVPAETQRIENAVHQVTRFAERGNIFRVDNGIVITRAIGDLRYKDNAHLGPAQQTVTAFPDVRTEMLTDDMEFLSIVCDGIWDCMSSQEVVTFIRTYRNNIQPLAICEALLEHCLAQPRGRDNMTSLLVKFKGPVQPAIACSIPSSIGCSLQPPPPQPPSQASAAKSGTGSSPPPSAWVLAPRDLAAPTVRFSAPKAQSYEMVCHQKAKARR